MQNICIDDYNLISLQKIDRKTLEFIISYHTILIYIDLNSFYISYMTMCNHATMEHILTNHCQLNQDLVNSIVEFIKPTRMSMI